MSNSKFLSIQKDICEKPDKAPEPDRICASCVPNPDFIPPDWWLETQPWLNKATCEYSVAVTINEEGRIFKLSDLEKTFEMVRKIVDNVDGNIDTPVSNESLIATHPDGLEAGAFELIKRTYKKPGIRKLLRHYGKLESDEIICAAINVEQKETEFSSLAKFVFLAGVVVAGVATGLIFPVAGTIAGTTLMADLFRDSKKEKDLCRDEESMIENPNLQALSDGLNSLLDEVGLIFGAEQVAACADMAYLNYSDFIKVRQQLTSFHSSQQYKTLEIEEKVKDKFCDIKNLNAVELYTRVADYHFHGLADNAISVLVTIPAHIFDQIPSAPNVEGADANIESVKFTIAEFTTYISKLHKTLSIFSKFQSAFYQNESGKMIQSVPKYDMHSDNPIPEATEEPPEATEEAPQATEEVSFYIKTYVDKVLDFENRLASFIESKGYGYPGGGIMAMMRGAAGLENDVGEIEIFFDKSDPSRPFKLTDTIKIKPKSCNWKTLKLPAEPEPLMLGMDVGNLRSFAFHEQTAMGYIANYASINRQINARETPPWLDFILDNTWPKITVNYGTSTMFSDKSAINCLAENLGTLDDLILNESLSFFEAFQYQMNKNNCKIMKNLYKTDPPIFDGKKKTKKAEKIEAKKRKKKLDQKSGLYDEMKKTKENSTGGETTDQELESVLSKLNPCNWKQITMKAIKCLLAEMTVEDGYKEIIKSTLGSVSSAGLELIIESLPYDKQQEIKKEVEKSFKDMPAPWDAGWESGDLGAAVDATVMDNITKKVSSMEDLEVTKKDLQARITKNTARIEEISKQTYIETQALKSMGSDSVKQHQDKIKKITQQLEEEKTRLTQNDNKTREMTQLKQDVWQGILEDEAEKAETERKLEHLISTAPMMSFGGALVPNEADANQMQSYRRTIESIDEKIEGKKRAIEIYEEQLVDLPAEKDHITSVIKIKQDALAQAKSDAKKDGFVLSSQSGFLGSGNVHYSLELAEKNIKKEVEKEIAELKVKIADDEKKLETSATDLDKKENKANFAELNWNNLTPEDQQKAIQDQKDQTRLVSLREGDKVKQGTLGRALGNVQKAVTQAYIDQIMKSADVMELMNAINKLPGAKIIGSFLTSFDCPRDSLIYPPIDSFLSSLTLDPCGPGKTRMALPEVQQWPQRWNPFAGLGDAFSYAFKKSVGSLLTALLVKQASILEASACRSVEAAKKVSLNLLSGEDAGLSGIIDELVCKEAAPEKKDNAAMNLFNATGVPQASPASARELLDTMSVLGSENDFKKAMVYPSDEQDGTFLDNLARTVSAVHPEYSQFIGSGQQMGQFLQAAGGLLSPEQVNTIMDDLESPLADFPLDSSICLTKAEAEEYDDQLTEFYSGYVGPALAKDFVDKQKDRKKSDLADLAEALAKGPEDFFKDTINNALAPPDPDCKDNQSLIKIPENIKDITAGIASSIFVPLKKSFSDDTMEENIFEAAFGFDSVGIMLTLLSDVVGYNMAKHSRIRTNLIFKALAWIGIFDAEAPYPNTIGRYMREYMLDLNGSNNKYKNGEIYWGFKDNIYADGVFIGYASDQYLEEKYTITITEDDQFKVINHNDFNYRFHQRGPDFKTLSGDGSRGIIIERPISEEESSILSLYEPTNDTLVAIEKENTYSNHVLKNIINEYWENIPNVNVDLKFADKIIEDVNNIMFTKFRDSLLKTENGGIPQGFKHGGNAGIITLDDLTYVDPKPGSTEYTYTDDERVLGRSMTNNPRIKFLNPEKYGGSFEVPNIYIDPVEASGWMRMSRMIIPDIDGCSEDTQSSFLRLEELEKFIAERQNQIPLNEELSKSPDCVTEVPFNKIASPSTLATLEGIITASIRVFLSEVFILGLPIFSAMRLSGDNYDELITEFIVAKMEKSLSEQGSWMASTYEKYTYWLLFLEQVIETYDRKIKLGEITADIKTEQILEKLKLSQREYNSPNLDILANVKDFSWSDGLTTIKSYVSGNITNIDEFIQSLNSYTDQEAANNAGINTIQISEIIAGIYIIASNSKDWVSQLNDDIEDSDGELELSVPFFLTLSQARLASKIVTIEKYKEDCKLILNRLVMDQINYYGEIIKKEMSPRPQAYDIYKYFLGASKSTAGKTCRAGLYDIEVPVGEGNEPRKLSSEEYGDINDCSPDGKLHPLEPTSGEEMNKVVDFFRDNKSGSFYLEKYLRIVEHPNPKPQPSPPVTNPKVPLADRSKQSKISGSIGVPSWIVDRPEELKNIVNIQSFKSYLADNKELINPNLNISDYFGDAVLKVNQKETEKTSIEGSIGIKFGVRLCYIPAPDSFNLVVEPELERIFTEHSVKEKTLFLNPIEGTGLNHTKWCFPMTHYEQDIHDVKLIDLVDSDNNLNQNLKCYIDALSEDPKFRLIFDKIFNLRKIPSFMACYSVANFFPSLGLYKDPSGEEDHPDNERRPADLGWLIEWLDGDPPAQPSTDERGDIFNDCKSQLRKIFIAIYKRNDFDPKNEDSSFNLSLLFEKIMAQTYNLLELDDKIPWWYRKRIINGKSGNPKDKKGKDCKNQFGKLFD